jgi:hypothetical protein
MLKKPENVVSSFDRLILRQAQDEVAGFFNGFILMVSLSNHELVEPWAIGSG